MVTPLELTAQEGATLSAELGCGACHGGLPGSRRIRETAPRLEVGTLPPDFVFVYLEDPTPRRDDIGRSRMPDFRLDEAERVALTLFLAGEPGASGPFADARERHAALDARRGETVFGALGCASCHTGTGLPAWRPGPDLSREGARVRTTWLRDYLADPEPVRPAGVLPGSRSRMPDFRLSQAETDVLARYLSGLGAPAEVDWDDPGEPPSTVELRNTEGFVQERLSCLGCHRLGDEGGRVGPSLNGLGRRLRPGFVRAILADPSTAAPGSYMPAQPLAARDRDRVARYLLHREGEPEAPRRRSLARGSVTLPWPTDGDGGKQMGDVAGKGRRLYENRCAMCHGPEGRGDGWNAVHLPVQPTPHADAVRMSARPDDTLFDGIHAGGWVLEGSPRMPAFGETLDSEQIRALVAYIRELCDCRPPRWSRDGGGEG